MTPADALTVALVWGVTAVAVGLALGAWFRAVDRRQRRRDDAVAERLRGEVERAWREGER